jgi:hypothetical protein
MGNQCENGIQISGEIVIFGTEAEKMQFSGEAFATPMLPQLDFLIGRILLSY